MLASFLAASLVTLCSTGAQGVARDEVWNRLASLEQVSRGSAGADLMESELRELTSGDAAVAAGLVPPFDTLLQARLDRWAGRPVDAACEILSRAPVDAFTARERWLLAEVLPAGPARVRVVLEAMRVTPVLSRTELELAWNTAVDEARALRFEAGALPIQREIHARYDAAWSAGDLALSLARMGDRDAVDAIYRETVAKESAAGRDTSDLYARWGLATFGFGDESRARDYLGRALANGSTDAALVLGRAQLIAGDRDIARATLRPSILSPSPSAWALRGWGMALLPEPHTVPKTTGTTRPNETR